jgi:hypothetical protein
LLSARHDQLVKMSIESFDTLLGTLLVRAARGEGVDLDDAAEQLFIAWTSLAGSEVMKAELEFLLEAARSAELHRLEEKYEKVQFDRLSGLLAALGSKRPLGLPLNSQTGCDPKHGALTSRRPGGSRSTAQRHFGPGLAAYCKRRREPS